MIVGADTMATVADTVGAERRDGGFFLWSAFLMALVLVAGFSLQLAAGRSSFGAPWYIHAHAVIFFGWVTIYVAQTVFATRGPLRLHRMLGWVAVGWVVAMVIAGLAIIALKIRAGQAPFFFLPQHFLVANSLIVLVFAGLTAAAVSMRRRTDWHRRLHMSAMVALLGPGFGRLLPMPLMMPWAYQIANLPGLAFIAAGMIADYRRDGRVHPAWWWGLGAFLGWMILSELIVYSPLGTAIYQAVTAGSPGAAVAPLDFAPPPPPMG
ncbi:hypothetical protein OK349_01650 [Sphingomonas sp. BT-65]|uniref:hypothetical protein n=1 Tax=Sphingomonas sp. BT-65 TaxID=2989821 RepID=UPI002236ACF2|nr:hypothetical protein [Sphingomonas sp. BT-65]MCW4460396.1 hypothetical protein [Sphingomonas sp. BT-65]